MPIDPQADPKYNDNVLNSPRKPEAVDISAGDHAATTIPTCMWVGGGGTLYASLAGASTTFNTYTNVSNGYMFVGQWHTIRSDTTCTNMVLLRP